MKSRSPFERPSGGVSDGRRLRRLRARLPARAPAGRRSRRALACDAPGVDAHLAGAQQLLQIAVADVGEMHAEPAVEAHAGLVASDLDGFDRCAHVSSQRVTHIPA